MQIPSKSEWLAADERAFRTHWCVYEDYTILQGTIVPLVNGRPVRIDLPKPSQIVKSYLPMLRLELPFEFSKLAHSSEDAVLKFVRNYGLLGYRNAAFTTVEVFSTRVLTEILDREERERQKLPPRELDFDFRRLFHPYVNAGDPVSWVLSHAETVKFVLDLSEALKDRHQLKVQLERLTVQSEDTRTHVEYRFARRGSLHAIQCQAGRKPLKAFQEAEDDFVLAREIIAHIINANLSGGVSRALTVDFDRRREGQNRKPTLLSVFQAESLIDCIYWHLADAIAGETIRRCLFCGRFFNATTGKRRYCPPPMGYEGDGPCAQNDRARRKRDRDREMAKNEKEQREKVRKIRRPPPGKRR